MASSRFHSVYNFLAILLVIAHIAPAHPVAGRKDEVSELLRLVNELRASFGLDPYVVDPGLMALAQEHSEYQASIRTSTHQHSDGNGPPQLGVVENVAGGDIGYLTPYAAVYEVWADPVHQRTMVGFPAGSMGVGVADDGETVYYTLEVRQAGAATPKPGTSGDGTAPVPLTPIPLATLVPATPLPDGSIVHIVGYGETLWAIALAYGIRVDQIRAWNNLAADASDIYPGQHLLVRPANLVTVSPTLPTEPDATEPARQQKEGGAVSTAVSAVDETIIPSPAGNTPTVAGPAVLRPTDTETRDDIPAASKDAPAEAGSLAPLLAAVSLLIGCVLLLIVRINRKLS